MKRRKAALACSVCGSRNYSFVPSKTSAGVRIEVQKFCKYCGKHTLHKETK